MRIRNIVVLLFLLIFIASCASPTGYSDGQLLNANEGAVVARIYYKQSGLKSDSGHSMVLNYYRGSTADSRELKIEKNDELVVIPLPAGRYTWRFMRWPDAAADFSKTSGFNVTANTVTYIGDIHISRDGIAARIRVINNFKTTLNMFKERYPKSSKKYKTSIQISKFHPQK